MNGPHVQVDRRRFVAYAGAWWSRWGFGAIASRDDEGDVTVALICGPFYVGVGVS